MTTKSDNKETGKTTLVKSTDLPRHGNPYPPKDFIQNEQPPTLLESKITSIRTSLSPYTAPLGSAFGRVGDIMSTGFAHSSSALQRIKNEDNAVTNSAIIAGATVFGYVIGRRRRFLAATVGFLASRWYVYPKDSQDKAQMLWYIASNKLPEVAKQYEKHFGTSWLVPQNESTKPTKENPTATNQGST